MPSQKKSNPTEVHLSTGRDIVQRTLVFRNVSGKDFVLKLIASHSSVSFPTNVFRFPPNSHRVIQFRVDARKLGQWDKTKLNIKGFVLPVYSKGLKQFIDQKNVVGTAEQEAFSLAVKFSDQFSAPQTVVNLPGNAACIESSDHPVDVEELDTTTAVNIEKGELEWEIGQGKQELADMLTAMPIGSMIGYVEEYKRRQTKKGCWLTNYICGGEEKPDKSVRSRRSAHSTRSANRSVKSQRSVKGASCRSQTRRQSQVNACLEATPCGGSTIQVWEETDERVLVSYLCMYCIK